ncbi:MAG TPA: ATP synthase subunit I [Acidimicrobiales bacterium]|nr:ATP synthase subunit I [Acidimicrobiales bacterium]
MDTLAVNPVPPVEKEIVTDMARRAAYAAPVIVIVAGAIWGGRGALSAAYALGLVLLNFALSATILTRAAKMSPNATMAAVLGGFLFRMTLVAVAIALVNDAGWVSRLPLGLTVVGTHLGLLMWEARFLSVSLAFPALKPKGQ